MAEKLPSKINITVTFAAADGPYRHAYLRTATIEMVREDALKEFGITVDGSTRYYLLHDGAEVAPSKTVGEVAERAHNLKLRLRTETIQG